jgi:glycosyltransferase involved in cell wall biosynthesis
LSSLSKLLDVTKSRDIKIVTGNYGNPGSARNAGLELVETDWVCFWDSDDLPKQDSFLQMIKSAEESHFLIAKGAYQIENANNNQWVTVEREFVDNDSPEKHLLDPGLWRYAFSKEIYQNVRFPPLRMGEDQDFLVQALLSKTPVYQSSEVIYVYRIGHAPQLSREKSAFNDASKSLQFLKDLLDEYRDDRIASRIILTSYLKQLLSTIKHSGIRNLNHHQSKAVSIILSSLFSGVLLKPFSIVFREVLARK